MAALHSKAIVSRPLMLYIVELYNIGVGSTVPAGQISSKFRIVTVFAAISSWTHRM
jgi:hypothetical protein